MNQRAETLGSDSLKAVLGDVRGELADIERDEQRLNELLAAAAERRREVETTVRYLERRIEATRTSSSGASSTRDSSAGARPRRVGEPMLTADGRSMYDLALDMLTTLEPGRSLNSRTLALAFDADGATSNRVETARQTLVRLEKDGYARRLPDKSFVLADAARSRPRNAGGHDKER